MKVFCCNMALNVKVTRKWELFAGRNRFYCDGYLMSAPNTGVFYLTVFLITITSILFFAFDCPYLSQEITPAFPIIGAFLYFFTMGSLLRTTFTDPGVIPRASHDEAAYIEKQIEVPNSMNSPTYRPPPRTKEVLVKGQTVKLKYCFTCKIFRPPRASHCSLCDNCVDRFDHHCPWVGNCVGRRNYRFFYMFIVSLAFLAVFIFSCSLTHLIMLAKDGENDFGKVVQQAPFSVVVTLICFLSIWSVIGLAGFHTYLTTSDQTTNEDIKGSFTAKGAQQPTNPYSHGNICANCFYILCGPMQPSLIDRRGLVTDEYRIQMQAQTLTTLTDTFINQQPVSTNVLANKFYDIELSPHQTNPTDGMFKQRSYDNLQTGNSNSRAQLIDNELIPNNTIAHEDSILEKEMNDFNRFTNRKNQLNGSYSNLYDEKCNANDFENYDNDDRKSYTNIEICPKDNVYSNVPLIGEQLIKRDDIDEITDPLTHVYSNISPGPLIDKDNDKQLDGASSSDSGNGGMPSDDSSFVTVTIGTQSLTQLGDDTVVLGKSPTRSTLFTDDLDLDDPVLGTGNFNDKQLSKSISNGDRDDMELTEKIVQTTKPIDYQSTKKHNLPQVAIIDLPKTSGNGNTLTKNSTTTNSIPSNSNLFLSPSRMRILHDTTMIDTALDLDSLDDTILNQNSLQVGLAKTNVTAPIV